MSNEERALFQRLVVAVEALVVAEGESARVLAVIAKAMEGRAVPDSGLGNSETVARGRK